MKKTFVILAAFALLFTACKEDLTQTKGPPPTPITATRVIAAFDSGSCSGYLKSDGTCDTPAGGSGDVTGVGDCATGACLDGTSDGGTYIRLYDGDSNYGQIAVPNLSSDVVYTMPDSNGTILDDNDIGVTVQGYNANTTVLGATIGAAEVDADVATQAELDAVAALVDTDDEIIAIINASPSTQIGVPAGGTGAGTFTDGGLLVGAGVGAFEALAVGLTTQVLVGGGAGTNPAWGTDLPTAVTIGSGYIYRAGGTDVPDADVADDITASNYLPLAGGTLAGNLLLTNGIDLRLATTTSGHSWAIPIYDNDTGPAWVDGLIFTNGNTPTISTGAVALDLSNLSTLTFPAYNTGVITVATDSTLARTGTTADDDLYIDAYDTDTGPAYIHMFTAKAGTEPYAYVGPQANGLRVGQTGIVTHMGTSYFTDIELGAADDTTITRTGAGAIAVEGVAVILASGGTFTDTVITDASDATASGLRLPHGAAPSAPTNGDLWTTTGGLYARINGATVGPFVEAAGSTNYDLIGDPTGVGLITFNDGETATYDGAWDTETAITISLNAADLTGDTTGLLITAVDNDDANYIPLLIQDDQDVTPDDLFKVDYAGNVTALGALAVGSFASTEVDRIPITAFTDGAAPPAAAAVVSSADGAFNCRAFDGASNEDVLFTWKVPPDIDATQGIKFSVSGVVGAATAPANTEVVAFSLAGVSIGNSDAAGSVGTAQTSSLTADATYAQYDSLDTAFSSAITVTGLAAGETVSFELIRLATTTDTYAQDFHPHTILIKYVRLHNASF